MRLFRSVPNSMMVGAAAGVSALLGIAIALISSPGSFNSAGAGYVSHVVTSPSVSSSSTPSAVRHAGILDDHPVLYPNGSGGAGLTGSKRWFITTDDGKTWSEITLPSGYSSIVFDPSITGHLVAGGSGLQASTDGGKTWSVTGTLPAGQGPYTPLFISGSDPATWFVLNAGNLSTTSDSGKTWRALPGLEHAVNPVMASTPSTGVFVLADGSSVYQVNSNTSSVTKLASLPAGVLVNQVAATVGSPLVLLSSCSDGKTYLNRTGFWYDVSAGLGGPVTSNPSDHLAIGDGRQAFGLGSEVIYTADGGQVWHVAGGLPQDASIDALLLAPSGATALAYVHGGDIYASSDNGATWSVRSRAFESVSSTASPSPAR